MGERGGSKGVARSHIFWVRVQPMGDGVQQMRPELAVEQYSLFDRRRGVGQWTGPQAMQFTVTPALLCSNTTY
jgi:hypothetical protein